MTDAISTLLYSLLLSVYLPPTYDVLTNLPPMGKFKVTTSAQSSLASTPSPPQSSRLNKKEKATSMK